MSRVCRRLVTALWCGALVVPALQAQSVESPPAGSSGVRVEAASAGIRAEASVRSEQLTVGPLVAATFRHSDPGLAVAVPDRAAEIRRGSSRWSRAGKGALWGLGIYALAAGGYLLHEKLTCETSCYADGWALLGIAAWAPVAVGTGAVIGFALPRRD